MAGLRLLILALLAFSLSTLDVAAQDYRTWDRNGDGVITRGEWRGSVQEFRERDWNRDGVISGDELDDQDWAWSGDTETFASLDRNRDGRLNRGEWRGTRAEFIRADRDGDNMISRGEFMNLDAGYADEVSDFNALDDNRNGRIERSEWIGTRAGFNRLDSNNDGVLSRSELLVHDVAPASAEMFETLDLNNNGVITRGEWRGGVGRFNQYDVNRDGVITRGEFTGGGADEQMFTIDVRQPWTDTGLYVNAGDVVTFRADGSSQLRIGTNDPATPAGSLTGRNASNSPRPDRPAGALLVRLGNIIEAVGANGTFTARTDGRLYFGVNDDHFPDNSGEYRVFVSVSR